MKRRRKSKVSGEPRSREQLEAEFPGQVWDTREVAALFVVTGIDGSTVIVRRKSDNVVGTVTVQQGPPTLYFGFKPQPAEG